MRELLDHVRGGKMSDDRMKDFVRHLGELSKTDPETPNILYGNHTRRMSRERDRRQDTELLQVMSDWWEIGLYEMTQEAAITALVKALSHPDVYCNPLASQISTNFKKVVLIDIFVASFIVQEQKTVGAPKINSPMVSSMPSLPSSATPSDMNPPQHEYKGTVLNDC